MSVIAIVNNWVESGREFAPYILSAGGFLFGVLSYFFGVFRGQLKRNKPHRPLELSNADDTAFVIELDRIRERMGQRCMRAYFTKFHNGEVYIDGSDILKQSRTHEVVRRGISYQADLFKAIVVSTVTEEMELVIEKGSSWRLVEDIKLGKFRWLMEQQGGVVAIARCAVRKKGEIIGFVGADFDGPPGMTAPSNIDDLCEMANNFAQRLTYNVVLKSPSRA